MLYDVKFRNIILTRSKILDRYIEYQARMLNLTSEKLLESYKKSYNIDLVGLDNDLTMAESVKVL